MRSVARPSLGSHPKEVEEALLEVEPPHDAPSARGNGSLSVFLCYYLRYISRDLGGDAAQEAPCLRCLQTSDLCLLRVEAGVTNVDRTSVG